MSHQNGNIITEIVFGKENSENYPYLSVIESVSLKYTQKGKTYWVNIMATGKPRLQTLGKERVKSAHRNRNIQLSRHGIGAD